MRYLDVGGARMSVIGLGTWQFGSKEWGYGSSYDENVAGQIVNRALDLGVTLLDTAEVYGFGRSERILGKALAGRRDEAFLATKIAPVLPIGPIVAQRLHGSARRLGVETIDLYQLHQPNPLVPLGLTMPEFGRLIDRGMLRHAGVSNYGLARWKMADAAFRRPVLSNQVRYNLLDRRPERELLGFAQGNDRIIIAYSPLAQGLLSGRYDVDHQPVGPMRSGSAAFSAEHMARVGPVVDVLREIADAHDASPSQIALAWLMHRPNVVVIPGARSVAQLEANAAAADIDLKDDEDAALTATSDAYKPLERSEFVRLTARSRFGGLAGRLPGPLGRKAGAETGERRL